MRKFNCTLKMILMELVNTGFHEVINARKPFINVFIYYLFIYFFEVYISFATFHFLKASLLGTIVKKI